MIHLKNYDSFKNEHVNEGLFDLLKKAFNVMFKGLEEIYVAQTQRVFKDIQNQTQPKAVYDVLNKFLVISKNNFTKDLDGAKSLPKVRDASYSNMVSLYATFETAAKKLSNNKVSFDNIFGETPPKEIKRIFKQKDVKQRERMMLDFSNALVENLGGGLKIDPKDIADMKSKPVGAKQEKPAPEKPVDNKEQVAADKTQQKADAANAQQVAADANVNQKAEVATGEKTDTTAQQNASYKYIAEKVTNDQIKNLKDLVNQWYASNIYDKIEKNIKVVAKEAPAAKIDDINASIKNIKATNNKDGVKKMVTNVVNLNDKGKYAAVRDALAKQGVVKKDDIGKF